jgi:hypothetical protein
LSVPWLFLDFEASSLSKDSYPIEVGWVFEDGSGEATLIRPVPAWSEWDSAAEAIHHISRETLYRDGQPVDAICARLIGLSQTLTLLASAPSWDGHWLSMLLRGAGRPRHLIRLQDTEIAFAAAARAQLGARATDTAVAKLIADARAVVDAQPPGHRALSDARREWRIWTTIREAH